MDHGSNLQSKAKSIIWISPRMQFVNTWPEFLGIFRVYKSQLRPTADEIHVSGSTNAFVQQDTNRTKALPKCESTLGSHREDGLGVGAAAKSQPQP
ncbi:hypothetical protein SDJN03_07995, partial [Cucurbita argyrosperma subsp. sororia]